MKNEVKKQLGYKPKPAVAKPLAKEAIKRDCSQQDVIHDALSDRYNLCPDCGKKTHGGAECKKS